MISTSTVGLVLLRFGEAPWDEGFFAINDFRAGGMKHHGMKDFMQSTTFV